MGQLIALFLEEGRGDIGNRHVAIIHIVSPLLQRLSCVLRSSYFVLSSPPSTLVTERKSSSAQANYTWASCCDASSISRCA